MRFPVVLQPSSSVASLSRWADYTHSASGEFAQRGSTPHDIRSTFSINCSQREICSSSLNTSFPCAIAKYATNGNSTAQGTNLNFCISKSRNRFSSEGLHQSREPSAEHIHILTSRVTVRLRRDQILESRPSAGKDASHGALSTMEDRLEDNDPNMKLTKGDDDGLPTMEDIVATAAQEGVGIRVSSLGPTFRITVSSLDGARVLGKADGWIRVWTKGKILHLESVKLERGLSKAVGNIFGAGFFTGASAIRYGLDQGCRHAELMAIYDNQATHRKLVNYYTRLGFKAMYDVDEEDWKYFADRVMWGGVGTRMDADCEALLRKWSSALKPKSNLGPSSS